MHCNLNTQVFEFLTIFEILIIICFVIIWLFFNFLKLQYLVVYYLTITWPLFDLCQVDHYFSFWNSNFDSSMFDYCTTIILIIQTSSFDSLLFEIYFE